MNDDISKYKTITSITVSRNKRSIMCVSKELESCFMKINIVTVNLEKIILRFLLEI